MRFERSGVNGKLYVDGDLKAEGRSYGETANIEVRPLFYLGGVAADFKENAMSNLKVSQSFSKWVFRYDIVEGFVS